MFGILGDTADPSPDAIASDIISTIGGNITDLATSAASAVEEVIPNLAHGALRHLLQIEDGSDTGSGSDSSGGGLTPGQKGAIAAVVIIIGVCCGLVAWCKAKLCGDTDLHGILVDNPLAARQNAERQRQEAMAADYRLRVQTWGAVTQSLEKTNGLLILARAGKFIATKGKTEELWWVKTGSLIWYIIKLPDMLSRMPIFYS